MTRDRGFKRMVRDQGALSAFWIVYSQAQGGLSSLCAQLPHRVVDEDFWTLLDAGVRHIQDVDLLALLDRLRAEVTRCMAENGYDAGPDNSRELDQDGFARLIETLDRLDQRPRTVQRAVLERDGAA